MGCKLGWLQGQSPLHTLTEEGFTSQTRPEVFDVGPLLRFIQREWPEIIVLAWLKGSGILSTCSGEKSWVLCRLLKARATLQRQNAENLKQIFPEKEYQGLSPNFHIHVYVSELYIPTMGLPFLLEEICGPILRIYKSLTDT